MLTTEDGGRNIPFVPGGNRYRPQLSIEGIDGTTTCFIDEVSGRSELGPGEHGEIAARVLSPHLFDVVLKVGQKFELREGAKVVGRGEVLKVEGS